MASFGQLMICTAAVLSALAGAVLLARGSDRRYFTVGRHLLFAAAATAAAAILVLTFLLITHDYRVAYVRDYADRSMPLGYLLTAVWGGQAGSLVFWAVLQTWFTAAAAAWLGRRHLASAPVAFGFLSSLQVFFLLLVLFHSDPFAPLGTLATQGIGLNPLLRNPYMAFHPPTLFVGFVGFSIPLAFALAALVRGSPDGRWLTEQRPWILVAWVFLTIGNVLGMVWAYEELGWGGYWGWDPVENASLMPWLTSTALLHSAAAQQRHGVLRRWSVLLIVLTFELIIFGTFLTRSGIIESVHAFAGSTVGPYLLGLIAVAGVLPLVLLIARYRALRPARQLRGMLSREGLTLAGNWVFLVAAVFIWIATMMPALTEIFRNEKITLPPEFFNRWLIPVGLLLLLLLGMCTIVTWRRLKQGELFPRIAPPILLGIIAGCITVLAGGLRDDRISLMALAPAVSVALLVLLVTAIFSELRRIILTRSRHSTTPLRIGRKLGALHVHLAVAAMFLGFTGSAYSVETSAVLGPGEHLTVDTYRIGMLGLRSDSNVERDAVFADLDVSHTEENLGVMSPARFTYHSHPSQPTSEVIIHSTLGQDLFLALGEPDQASGRAIIRAVVNPLVSWIWIGGTLLVLGTLIALLKLEFIAAVLAAPKDVRSRVFKPGIVIAVALGVATTTGIVRDLAAGLVVLGTILLATAIYSVGGAAIGMAHAQGER